MDKLILVELFVEINLFQFFLGMIGMLVLQPVMRKALAPGTRMPIYQELGARFKAVQTSCLIVLLSTGIYKLWGLRHSPDIFLS